MHWATERKTRKIPATSWEGYQTELSQLAHKPSDWSGFHFLSAEITYHVSVCLSLFHDISTGWRISIRFLITMILSQSTTAYTFKCPFISNINTAIRELLRCERHLGKGMDFCLVVDLKIISDWLLLKIFFVDFEAITWWSQCFTVISK